MVNTQKFWKMDPCFKAYFCRKWDPCLEISCEKVTIIAAHPRMSYVSRPPSHFVNKCDIRHAELHAYVGLLFPKFVGKCTWKRSGWNAAAGMCEETRYDVTFMLKTGYSKPIFFINSPSQRNTTPLKLKLTKSKGLSLIVNSKLQFFFSNPQIFFFHTQKELHCNNLPIQQLSWK